jgi:hypothetical protein
MTETQRVSFQARAAALGYPPVHLVGTSFAHFTGTEGWSNLLSGRRLPFEVHLIESTLDEAESRRQEIERTRVEPGVGEGADELLDAELDGLIEESARDAAHSRTVEGKLDRLIAVNERIADRMEKAG